MLFVFITIIIVGAAAPQLKAADFVPESLRADLARADDVILLGGLGLGSEMIYQIMPEEDDEDHKPDVLFWWMNHL